MSYRVCLVANLLLFISVESRLSSLKALTHPFLPRSQTEGLWEIKAENRRCSSTRAAELSASFKEFIKRESLNCCRAICFILCQDVYCFYINMFLISFSCLPLKLGVGLTLSGWENICIHVLWGGTHTSTYSCVLHFTTGDSVMLIFKRSCN